jgi:cytoskeleton protein RodZ
MASQGKKTKDTQDEKLNSSKVGALLQASRLRLGHDLRFVAETLHIRYVYLEAIEAGRYEELPGAVYVVGFIRSYADFLGLDSEEVARRSKDEIASQSVNTELVFPVPIPESSIPGGAIILVGVIILILAYVGWYANTTNDALLSAATSPVPEHLKIKDKETNAELELEPNIDEEDKELIPEEAQSANSNAEEVFELTQKSVQSLAKPAPLTQTAETTEDKLVKEDLDRAPTQISIKVKPAIKMIKQDEAISKVEPTAIEETLQKPLVEPEPKIEPVAPEPGENSQESETVEDEKPRQAQASTSAQNSVEDVITAENKIYGSENEGSKILVKARRNSWIQVRDNKANKLLLTQLLRTGDSYQVPNRSGLVLLTGNAGALEILVDGESVPDLAPPGTILKNITLDPDKLRQGAAAQ